MVWSLYKRKEDDSDIGTGLFSYTGDKLPPLKFSNGKTQEDVVSEVLKAINEGNKMIFIKGVCGSGKSAMALNLAKNFEKTSIVVPIKSLQKQYEMDYTKKMFILKDDGNPLKIEVIKGRNNFPCIFGGDRADDPTIPCIIELKEKNTDQILKYIEQNPMADKEDFANVSDVRRMNVAPACPYWAPIMPSEVNPRNLGDFSKEKYMAVCGKEFAVFRRKKGCKYYDQYSSYVNADVLIFNSMKYLIESSIGRKPKTDVEIIDECDEFLDSFANERRINMNRLHTSLSNLMPFDKESKMIVKELLQEINKLLFDLKKVDIEKITESDFFSLAEKILDNPYLAEEEEINYYNDVVEIVKSFENLFDETYISAEVIEKNPEQETLFGKNYASEDTLILNLVSINLAEKLRELTNQNKCLVMMSGTLHSEKVLRDIFGVTDFKIIEAETINPGEIRKQRTGLERNCSYANFQNKTVTRKHFLKTLDVCLSNVKLPAVVHVNAFSDLPNEQENEEFKFDNLITREKLRELQKNGDYEVDEFLSGNKKILFTTKCSRGVDFPGDKCNSIVMTRYPYPNISGLFWKILKKEQPEKFMEFYMDKARRELFQKIARGLRFPGDFVELWSPDNRVLNGNV